MNYLFNAGSRYVESLVYSEHLCARLSWLRGWKAGNVIIYDPRIPAYSFVDKK